MAPKTREPVSANAEELQQNVVEATGGQIEEFLRYPKRKVVGVIDSAAQLEGALTALADLGVSRQDIKVFSGDEGIRRIDPKGKYHGLLGRLTRIVQSLGEELAQMERYENELRAGHFLVVISADPERREETARALRAHGGHFADYYGTLAIEHLVP
jgi:hypothetical protein